MKTLGKMFLLTCWCLCLFSGLIAESVKTEVAVSITKSEDISLQNKINEKEELKNSLNQEPAKENAEIELPDGAIEPNQLINVSVEPTLKELNDKPEVEKEGSEHGHEGECFEPSSQFINGVKVFKVSDGLKAIEDAKNEEAETKRNLNKDKSKLVPAVINNSVETQSTSSDIKDVVSVEKPLTPEQEYEIEKENYYQELKANSTGETYSSRDCTDTDNGATDNSGYSCADNGSTCYGGSYDDDDFDEMAMCCVCGGGQDDGDPEPECEGTTYTVSYDGAYEGEVSWSIDGQSSSPVCLADGTHTLTANDSYGDCWNGTLSFYNDLGEEVASATWPSCGWGEGSSTTFELCFGSDCAAPVPGCTDEAAENYSADATADDGTCTYNGGCSSASYTACDDFATSGQCVYTTYFCDGWVGNGSGNYSSTDCADGSDEDAGCCGIGDNNYTDDVCAEDCAGVVFGDAVVDCAGACGGDAVLDDCGVCNGDGSSCSCDDLTIVGCDIYGDTWDGASLSIGSWSWSGPAYVGGWTTSCESTTACIDMSVANDVTMGGGSYPGEHSWAISDANGNLLLEGGDPYTGCIGTGCPVYGCTLADAPNYNADAAIDDGSCEWFVGMDCGYWYWEFAGSVLGCGITSSHCYWSDPDGVVDENGEWDPTSWQAALGNGYCDAHTSYNDGAFLDHGLACEYFDCDGGDCLDCAGTCAQEESWATADCFDGTDACDVADCPVYCDGLGEGTAYAITVSSGSWNSEVSWTLSSADGEIASGGAPYGPEVFCIASGTEVTLNACDSVEDTWNGSVFTIADESGAGFTSYGPASGVSCEEFTFTLGIVYGCTDPGAPNYNPDATEDDGSCLVYPGMSCAGLCAPNPDGTDPCADLILGCSLAYCWSLEDIAEEAGDGDCESDFDCEEFNSDGCDCGIQYEDPDAACYVSCDGLIYTSEECDSYGDGWNGNTLCVGSDCSDGPSSNLNAGDCINTEFCLTEGSVYDVTFGGGPWQNEISWSLSDPAGVEVFGADAPDAVDFSAPLGIGVDVVSGCTDSEATNYDNTANYDDNSCEYATGADIIVYILTDNYAGETTWDITDADGTVVQSENPSLGATEYTYEFALQEGAYTFTIYDSFGDGICCNYGNGEYLISADGVIMNMGAEFNASDSTFFTIDADGAASVPGCTDSTANNYNEFATSDDGTCSYGQLGCMDMNSSNYDPDAEIDNGSCLPYPGMDCGYLTQFNADLDLSTYILGCGLVYCFADCVDEDGDGIICLEGEGDGIPESLGDGVCHNYGDTNFDGVDEGLDCEAFTYDECDCYVQYEDSEADCYEAPTYGCIDAFADNYDADATADDGSCTYCGGTGQFIECGGGSYQYEVSWSLADSDGVEVLADGAPYGPVCSYLSNGDYTLTMADSFGDGWNGNIWTIKDATGQIISFGTLDGVNDDGSSGTVSFEISSGEPACAPGDVNGDEMANVQDIVLIVGYILDSTSDLDVDCADMNADGLANVQDVVLIVNGILGNRTTSDATEAKLDINGGVASLDANGFVGAVQMTLSHRTDFELELTDRAMVSEYRTNGNSTTIVIVAPESDDLFTANGDFTVEEIIVANVSGEATVVMPSELTLSKAYPNPFNPSTSLNIYVPADGMVSLSVYNVMGQEVATLHSGNMSAGSHSVTWNASEMTSGLYFVRAESDGGVAVQKVMLMK